MAQFIRTITLSSHRRFRLSGLIAGLDRMLTLARQRRQLRSLDRHQLADIGITAEQAQAEAKRAVWDAPRTWRL